MNLFKESVEYNISVLLPSLKLKAVSAAAFSLARYKIDLSFFKDLNQVLVDFHQSERTRLWKGYQLIAGDGSTVSLPPSRAIKDHFGVYSQSAQGIKTCMAQMFMLFDVTTDTVISGRIDKMERSEKALFRDCLGSLPAGRSIFILDRGFGYFSIIKGLVDLKRDFCIRISTSQSDFAKLVLASPLNDFITDWKPSESEKQTCKKHGQDCQEVRVRASKVRLKSGEVEILVSSLDMGTVKLGDMAHLYGLRWGIEEGFKKLKPKMKLEHFGSRKPEGIFQEFEAHIFMINLVAIMGTDAQEIIDRDKKNRKHRYKYNWQNAFRFVRNSIIQLLIYQDLKDIVNDLVLQIARSVVAIKPQRSFSRIRVKKTKTRLHQCYK